MADLLERAVEALREKGLPKADKAVDRGLSKAIEKAREWVQSDEGLAFGGAPVRAAALDGLDRIERAAPSLGHLASREIRGLFEQVFQGYGSSEEVRNTYFRTAATYEERIERAYELASYLAEETIDREKAWEEFKALLKDLGTLALRTLVPLVLAAL